ncbi:vWA domain-containing protein [Leucobacter japonicus]|uniref:vWA domain-containing protein n=1 Tax=Leucobacter japonicus TaxID=1461259 RepID=UPI0006A7DCD2|nr:vWA domain-containing protein [Leucobacter japonicus]
MIDPDGTPAAAPAAARAECAAEAVPGADAEARAQARAQLEAVRAIIGITLDVSDGDHWERTDDGLSVGLGWYAARGHGVRETVALALLHLWEGPRAERVEVPRSRRRASLARLRPNAIPLFDAVHRAQAVAELIGVMPGLRSALGAALARSLPTDVSALPRHLQWVVLVLAAAVDVSDADRISGFDREVRVEWQAVNAEADVSTGVFGVRRVLNTDRRRSALQRYLRAIALLLPGYERLLVLDARERGLDADGANSDADARGSEHPDDVPADLGLTAPGSGDSDASAQSADDAESTPDPGADPNATDDRARAGEGRERAEGADLFAAEHAGFVERMLDTPMPGGGHLDSRLPVPSDRARDAEPDPSPTQRRENSGAGSGGGAARVSLDAYRTRAEALSAEIERMRSVWAEVIADRLVPRRHPSSRPRSTGSELAIEALASAVAEARAGAPQPRAFRDHTVRMRRTRRTGSTDYVLIIDRSASMQGAAASLASDAMLIMCEGLAGVARDVADAERVGGLPLDLDIRVALIVFDSTVEVVKPLSAGMSDAARIAVHAALREPRGSTNDGAALRAAATALGLEVDSGQLTTEPLERRRVVILVTDGGSNDPLAAEHAAKRLRRAGIRVHAIGLGAGDTVVRYAPDARRIDDVRALPDALRALVVDEVASSRVRG